MHVPRFFFFLALLLAATGEIAWGDAASPTATDVTRRCSLHVEIIDDIGALPDTTRMYAVALQGDAGEITASGTIAFYSGDARYVAPFQNAVAGEADRSPNASTPIVVTFPAGVHPEYAYVVSLSAPTPGACEIGNVWSPQHGQKLDLPSEETLLVPAFDRVLFDGQAVSALRTASKLDARESPPPCGQALQPFGVVNNFPIDPTGKEWRALRKGQSGSFTFVVRVAASGAVEGETLLAASARNRILEAMAKRGISDSTFTAPVFRCKPVYGSFLFTFEQQ